MNVPPCGWKTTGGPARSARSAMAWMTSTSDSQPASVRTGVPGSSARPAAAIAIGGSVDRQAQHLALAVVQEAQPLLGDGQRVGSRAVDASPGSGRRPRRGAAPARAGLPGARHPRESRRRAGCPRTRPARSHRGSPSRRCRRAGLRRRCSTAWARSRSMTVATRRRGGGATGRRSRRDAVTVLTRAFPPPCFGPARALVRTVRGSLRDALTTGSTPLLARAA